MRNIMFGNGFAFNSKPTFSSNLYNVNVSNGMPIVSDKKPLVEKSKSKKSSKKTKDGWPKELKKGRFTKYCGGKPDMACAKRAMKSKDPSVRGMASFWMNTTLKNPKTRASALGKSKKSK